MSRNVPDEDETRTDLVARGYTKSPDGTYSRVREEVRNGLTVVITDTILISEAKLDPVHDLREAPIPHPDAIKEPKLFAIDFETANSARSSVCSVGLAWGNGTTITHVAHRLVRPQDMKFDAFNSALHGICAEHVADRPEFPGVWAELRPHFEGATVLAHCASFDMSVLRYVLDLYDIAWPEVTYGCTMKIAQEVWPGLPDHRLSTLADHLGIELHHHNAQSDAAACLQIALRAAQERGVSTVQELASSIGLRFGRLMPSSYVPCSSPPRKLPARFLDEVRQATAGSSLQGKRVVFTGTLASMLRSEAGQLVEAAGGIWCQNVRRDTDLLVVGEDPGGLKLAKSARQMDRYGRPELIDESEFLRMLCIL